MPAAPLPAGLTAADLYQDGALIQEIQEIQPPVQLTLSIYRTPRTTPHFSKIVAQKCLKQENHLLCQSQLIKWFKCSFSAWTMVDD